MRFILVALVGLSLGCWTRAADAPASPATKPAAPAPKPPLNAKPFVDEIVYRFDETVFNTDFPKGHFEQERLVNAALGKPQVETTFYNAQFQPVAHVTTPGRYGAVVRATFADGSTFTGFYTLFKITRNFWWRTEHLQMAMKLSPAWNVDQALDDTHPAVVNAALTDLLGDSTKHNTKLAVLLAGLSEMKDAPDAERAGPKARDAAWWWELKKKTGLAHLYDYLTYLPDGYDADPAKKWPLILFLHGSGERGSDVRKVADTGLPQLIAQGQKFPAIIISPQCPANDWWNAQELSDLLDTVVAKYRVDTDRISVTGLSMGGFGTWDLALAEPERFSAIAPVCGGGDTLDAARLAKLPVWAFHGGQDAIVSTSMSVEMVKAIEAAGGKPHLTIYPKGPHWIWMDAYKTPALYDWLLAQKRGEPEVSVAGVPTVPDEWPAAKK